MSEDKTEKTTDTPRAALERETLASIKPTIAVLDSWDVETSQMVQREIMILPIPYEKLQDGAKLIAKIAQSVMKMGVQTQSLGEELVKIAGTTRSADDGGSSGDAVSAVAGLVDKVISPEMIMGLGDDAESAIEFIIAIGTDTTLADLKQDWATVPLQLAVKVMAKNLGPELINFFSGELSGIVKTIKVLSATSSRKPSSLEPATKSEKSEDGPSENSSAGPVQSDS